MMNNIQTLLQSCNILTGIGSQLSEKLQRLGIYTLFDLLLHLPFRYQDRTRITAIRDLSLNQPGVVLGTITSSQWMSGRRKVYHCDLEDASGSLGLRFFHMPAFQQNRLKIGQTIKVFGEVKSKPYGLEMIHPEIEVQDLHHPPKVQEFYTPWYPSTQGMHQSTWRKLIQQLFKEFHQEIIDLEWLSANELQRLKLPRIYDALSTLHFPSPEHQTDVLCSPLHPARCRLALDEFISHALSMQLLRQQNQNFNAKAYSTPPAIDSLLTANLPFQLTSAQQQVIQEIRQDLNQTEPMLRLLQGDVGSGKTIVCALIALAVLNAGHQVAFMAPTDLLSEQHYQNMQKWLQPLGYEVVRLNRSTATKEKKQNYTHIANGKAQVIVGTHALFQDKVIFQHLGLVIIDEQHRFGVLQRLKLIEKANPNFHPHQLFVTATPIPRTLALTQFSHFDVSIIDKLPQGRKPIKTAVLPQNKREELIERIKPILQQKGQIYWVCTRIEEDEQAQILATEEIETYLNTNLPSSKIERIHGKLKAVEKDSIMQEFKQGDYDILVATTVIEVGVDVPNANIIIIENAERLGLSQLHQLRGRVGRGQDEAYCILLYNPPLSEQSQKRLHIIRQSSDGFWLAEQDLLIRGSGDLFGTQQTGFTEFKIAQIPDHIEYLKLSTTIAQQLRESQSKYITTLLEFWYPDSDKYLKA